MRRVGVVLGVYLVLTIANSAHAEPSTPMTVLPTTAGRAIATRPEAQASPPPVKRRGRVGTYCPLTRTITFEDGTTVSVPSGGDYVLLPLKARIPPPAPKVGDWPAAPPTATLENAHFAGGDAPGGRRRGAFGRQTR
jgi:hypothetical protein